MLFFIPLRSKDVLLPIEHIASIEVICFDNNSIFKLYKKIVKYFFKQVIDLYDIRITITSGKTFDIYFNNFESMGAYLKDLNAKINKKIIKII